MADNEVEKLRSRIEEQGQLICFLKQRADEELLKSRSLKAENEQLLIYRDESRGTIAELQKHAEHIENRFDDLASNHEEMIKIKDEYKQRCKELLEENAKLEKENANVTSAKLKAKSQEITELRDSVNSCRAVINDLKTENSKVLKKYNDLEVSSKDLYNAMERGLKDRLNSLQMKYNDLLKSKTNQESKLIKESELVSSLKKDKERLAEELISRGRLIQEKQDLTDQLTKELNKTKNDLNSMKTEFEEKADLVDTNSRVRKLLAVKDGLEEELSNLKFEFKTFKIYSNKVLSQEKDLNQKLRCNLNI